MGDIDILTTSLRRSLNSGLANKKYDLIVDQPVDAVLHFDFIKKAWCNKIINTVNELDKWTTDRHENYPTYDILLKDVNVDLNQEYVNVMDELVKPMLVEEFTLDSSFSDNNWMYECFIAKYTPELQDRLDLHHDKGEFASVLCLNKEYIGGGTYFKRQKTLLKGEAGEMTVHPGRITHLHGARPVLEGERYILVTFITIPGLKNE